MGTRTTGVPWTELGTATDTLRFAGAQSVDAEHFAIDLSGLQLGVGEEVIPCGGSLVGTDAGMPCKFPFVYQDVSYNECTAVGHSQPWCYIQAQEGEPQRWGSCMCELDF